MRSPDFFPGADKDHLKHKMLEHESVYGNQVFEFHRAYRVQKNLMEDIRQKEQSEDKTRCETSSSSSALPSQMTPDYAHQRNSASFLLRNSVSGPEFLSSSDGSPHKGKSLQGVPVPFKNCASPRNSVVSEFRPTKLRKMIDLELPPDEYMDTDEVELCSNRMVSDTKERLFPSHLEKTKYHEFRRPYALADLNEPFNAEETTADPPSVDILGVHRQNLLTTAPSRLEDASWKPGQWNMNATQVSSSHNDVGKGQNWFSSVLKAEGTKDNGKSVHHTKHSEMPFRPVQVFENYQQPRFFPPHQVRDDPLLAKANNDLIMYEKSRSLSSYNNPEGLVASHQTSYPYSSNLVNSWNHSWDKSSNYLIQKPMPVQMIPFFHPDSLSKSSQSSSQSNGFHGPWWHRNVDRRSIPDFHSETPVQNGFDHGSSSGRCKELPAHFSKAGRDYASGSCNDNTTSGSSSFLKVKNSFDLNSSGDLNLNVVPNGLSDESFTQQGEPKQEDPVSVLPWLRAKPSNNDAARARNNPDTRETGLLHDPRELRSRNEVRNALDHQSCLTSTSSNADATREKGQAISVHPSSAQRILGVPIFQAPLSGDQEIDSGKKKVLFDINVPFDEPEEFGNTAATSEAVMVAEKVECEHPNGFRNMFDLNSCLTEEEEIPSRTSVTNSSTTANSLKNPERCLIDLEAAPVDLEAEEEGSCDPDEDSLLKLARVAAEAIVTISSSVTENHIDETMTPRAEDKASGSEDILCWFVDTICSFPDDVVETCLDDDKDCLSNDSDYLEEMTLNLTECTVKEYFPNPPNFDNLAVTEPAIVTGQTRRTRRGRQRRDFQRDILPGLTSLARNEITEDVQTFVGLMRATGHDWQCGGRRNNSRNGSGRGRRRTVVTVHPPSPPVAALPPVNATTTAFTSHAQDAKNGEIILEDRSLTGWGKTTRRPRRQRCPPSSR